MKSVFILFLGDHSYCAQVPPSPVDAPRETPESVVGTPRETPASAVGTPRETPASAVGTPGSPVGAPSPVTSQSDREFLPTLPDGWQELIPNAGR